MNKTIKTLIILTFLFLFSTLSRTAYAEQLYKSDEFDSFNVNTWEVFGQLQDNSQYVKSQNGELLISSPPGLYTSYVRSKQNLFPMSGDFLIEVKFRYPTLTFAGTGIVIGDSNPNYPVDFTDPVNSRIITIWQDQNEPLFGLHNRIFFPPLLSTTSNIPHIATIRYISGIYKFFLDNSLIYTAENIDRRANSIWFGNPGPAVSSQQWSSLLIDYVRTYTLDTHNSFSVSSEWDGSGRQVPIDRTARIAVKVTTPNGDPVKDAVVSAEILNSGVGDLDTLKSTSIENGEAYFIFTPKVAAPAHFRFTVDGEQKAYDLNVYRPPVVIVPGMAASLNLPKFLEDNPFSEYFWTWSPTAEQGWDDIISTLESNGYSKNSDYAIAFYDWRKSLHPSFYASGVPEAVENGIGKAVSNMLQGKPSGQKVNILSHSFGGIVSRAFLKYDSSSRVNRLVTLATPHLGSSNIFYIWDGGTMPPTGDAMFRIITDTVLNIYKHQNILSNIDGVHSAFPAFLNLMAVYDDYVFAPTFVWGTRDMSYENNIFHGAYTLDDFKQILTARNIAFTPVYSTGAPTLRNIKVAERIENAREWVDGKPYKNQTLVDGDNSVLPESGQVDGYSNVHIMGEHGDVPDLSLTTIKNLFKIGVIKNNGKAAAKNMLGALMLSPATVDIISPGGDVLGSSVIWDETKGTKFAYAADIASGIYTLKVTGTGTGAYTLHVPFAGNNTFWEADFTGETKKGQVTTYPIYVDTRPSGVGGPIVKTDVKLSIGSLNIPKRILPITVTFDVPKKFDTDQLTRSQLLINNEYVPILSSKIDKSGHKVSVDVNAAAIGKLINWDERNIALSFLLPGEERSLYGSLGFKLNWGLYKKFF